MQSTVNVPVTISVEWIGPDGMTIMPAEGPEMISFTLYSSSYTLHSIELADSGRYTCTVKVETEPEVYTSTKIIIGKNNESLNKTNKKIINLPTVGAFTGHGAFQLRLKSVGICQHVKWHSEVSHA